MFEPHHLRKERGNIAIVVQVVLPARVVLQEAGRELTLCSAMAWSCQPAPEEEQGPRARAVKPQHARATAALPARLLLQPPKGQWKITIRRCIVCLQTSRAKHNRNSLRCEVQTGTGAARSQCALLLVCDCSTGLFCTLGLWGQQQPQPCQALLLQVRADIAISWSHRMC